MRQTVNVLVVEDNEYYNNLIFNALQQSIHFVEKQLKCKLVLHTFTDYFDCMRKIESEEFTFNDTVAFVDHNLGNGISGMLIIKLLKKINSNTLAVLLSQSPMGDGTPSGYDFSVIKDTFAPALCRLYLDQYIENKFS